MRSIRGRVRLTLALIVLLAAPASSLALARDLSFDERVTAQKAIEQIYWNHRIWPNENPGPKPPLSAVMTDAAIRAKVEDDLRMSALLEAYWHQPPTGERLQAEIERMARQTKAPETLRELFAALHDDPFLIAECLARPTLTRRLVASAFAEDERIHGAQRRALFSKLVGVSDLETLERLDGVHAETKFVLDDGPAAKDRPADPRHRAFRLSRNDWNRELGRLAESFGPAPASAMSMLPVGRVSRLVDRGNRWVVLAIRAKDATSVTVASVSWMKRTYGDWAREAAGSVALGGGAIAPPLEGYSVPALSLGDCVDDTWEPTTGSDVPDARSGHTAIWTGSEVVVWGGGTTTGGRYDPSTDSWVATSAGANAPVGCSYHTAIWTGSEMIVWGGVCGAAASSTGGRYDPVTDTWAASSLTTGSGANVPPASGGHTALWTGSEMIVWGGFDTEGPVILNTGGRYNPVTDTWAASSLTAGSGANVPPASFAHEAVWTGSEMIVWGGINYVTGYLNTGGRYDPVTDTWAASSLTTGSGSNVPEARYRHTALWTGSEIIVWGGYGLAPGVFGWKTGGRYNPSTDTWVPSSLTTGSGANVPAARYDHTCVWTGSEMIVWGGTGDSVSLSTGGRYNPVSDTWSLSSLTNGAGANVPPACGGHTAVWTGTEMIVWGGYFAYASNVLSTGGLYCAQVSCASQTWYRDADADGHGNPAVTQSACVQPPGYVATTDDCDDTNPAIHPGALEVCDGLDNDCDTVSDNGGNALCNDDNACTADVCVPSIGCPPIHKTANMDTTDFSSTRVDGLDLVVLADAWNSCPTDPVPTRYNADADLDPLNPCVEDGDFHQFMNAFGRVCP